MYKQKLLNLIDKWIDITGRDPNSTSFRLGARSDFSSTEALKLLEQDTTGSMSIIEFRRAFKYFLEETSISLNNIQNGEDIIEYVKKVQDFKT